MATRGRPRKNPVESKEVNHEIHSLTHQVTSLEMDIQDLHKIKEALAISNTKLLEHLSEKAKVIEEQESEIGKLEDENEHLKEIIKSLAEVL
jgi:chromosome segregation ATPase